MSYDKNLIDSHEQIYCASCIPSAVEMVLKLSGMVRPDYYDEQNEWRNRIGSFADYNGVTVHGLKFTMEFGDARGSTFPLSKLFDRIDDELAKSRYVIISLHSSGGWHMWVIHEKSNNEYKAVSKNCKQTIDADQVRQIVEAMQGTDILTYKQV